MAYIKDLLGIAPLEKSQIELILEAAEGERQALEAGTAKSGSSLKGASVITLFYENSTRTRVSFELAADYLGAHTVNLSPQLSSVQKGESLADTGKTLDRLFPDAAVIRHSMSGAPHILARHMKACVINAGDGMNEHPTQALLDALTLIRRFGVLKGLKVAIIGDILHSRVARSNICLLKKMGAEVSLFGPPTLMPAEIGQTGALVETSLEDALKGADAVMGLRIQKERQSGGLIPSLSEYARCYGINSEKMELAKTGAVLLHPGPVNRETELSAEVCDGQSSQIGEQVTNGLCVRMAVLKLLTARVL